MKPILYSSFIMGLIGPSKYNRPQRSSTFEC